MLVQAVNAQEVELGVPGQNLFVNKITCGQTLVPWLNGAGITVSIKEFQFDPKDVDLRARVLLSPDAAPQLTTHAGIMASLAGGAGNSDPAGKGVAPGCRLVSSSFAGLQPDADYAGRNITVQNHAYGVQIQNWYGPGALAYDQTTIENPLLLHVFSAGNKGDSLSLTGTYGQLPGFANLSGNFKMAKNVLLVGAVDSLLRLDPLSSRGPAYDGRIKPDLVAFGLDGTSGAAALVSGAAAVIQQTATDFTPGFPSSALVRAILINTADDLGRPGPDFENGFGNLNYKKAILLAAERHISAGVLAPGELVSLPLDIPPGLRRYDITLAWNDPPADLFASKALVNDLDIKLLDPSGNICFPWILNSFPHADSLRQPARRGRDTLNNVEHLTLDFPAAGPWKILISAPPQMNGSQDFSLAWSWDTLEHFGWIYPSLNDPAPSGREVILRWENNFPDSFARLEWKPFFKADWRLIEDSIMLQCGWKRWILPDTFTEAQVRMRIGSRTFSSEIFLISGELRVKIGFNCPDSLMLYWNAAHEEAQYQLFGLGEKYLEPIGVVPDTFVVLQKSAFPQPRFAVAALAQGDALGPRSPAPDISMQGVGCYFSNFLAELNADLRIELKLQIGSTYGVARVFFEKKTGDSFGVINEQPADQDHFSFEDESPQTGSNTYRPRIELFNGAVLTGDTVTVYFPGEKGWLVYPNPVLSQGVLHLISTTNEIAAFALFDALGKKIAERTIDELHIEMPLQGLPRGVYFYRVTEGKTFSGGGRLVIE